MSRMNGRMIVLLQAKQNSPSQKTCWWNERVQGGQRHVFRRSSSFLQRLHAKSRLALHLGAAKVQGVESRSQEALVGGQ